MPEENCPPSSAEHKDIDEVYRLTLNNPPTEEDFQSHIESGKKFPPGLECVAASVSVFKDKEDAERQKKKIPVFKNKGYISKGSIQSNTGVIVESSKSSHIDWWIQRGQTVHQYFK